LILFVLTIFVPGRRRCVLLLVEVLLLLVLLLRSINCFLLVSRLFPLDLTLRRAASRICLILLVLGGDRLAEHIVLGSSLPIKLGWEGGLLETGIHTLLLQLFDFRLY